MDAYLAHLREEAQAESNLVATWCRSYGVGLYLSMSESHRAWIRRHNPDFLG
jgi:hypothetical protein